MSYAFQPQETKKHNVFISFHNKNEDKKIDLQNKKAISKNAILTVGNKFDINIMLRQYNKIFNNLINHENK